MRKPYDESASKRRDAALAKELLAVEKQEKNAVGRAESKACCMENRTGEPDPGNGIC